MRHTGISHHLAFHCHEGDTARWADNSPNMIHRHYKEIVKKADAEKFWSIFPDGYRIEAINFGPSLGKSSSKSSKQTA